MTARPGILAAVLLLLGGLGFWTGLVNVGAPPDPKLAAEFPVTAMDHGGGFANNTPNLVAEPGDARFVVMGNRLDAPGFGCALQLSGDGGRTWVPAQPITALPEGTERCYAPEVAFGRDGTLFYLFVGLQGTGNEAVGAFLTTSEDRGRTFAPPQRVLGPFNYGVRMAVDRSGDRDRLHLAWLHATSDPPLGGFGPPPNPVQASYSDDGGRTFSPPVQVSDEQRQRVVAPALVLGARGAVHVAYYDLGDDARDYQGLEGPVWDGAWSIVLATSIDRGATFGAGTVVDDAIVPDERVLLIFTMPPPALVAGGGRLCAAWTDARNGDADALVRCSADAGRTWGGAPRRMNDDDVGNGRSQYQPRLGLAPDGRLDAIFYDRRNDPGDAVNEVAYTFSTDDAATFSRNRILTADPSDPEVGQRYANASAQGLVEFGSRMGLLSTEGLAVAAWTDTRNSRGGTGQDIFSRAVEFAGPVQPAWARGTGLSLIAAGLASATLALRRRRPVNEEGDGG